MEWFGHKLTASPEGLLMRADAIEGKLNDGGSCAAHLRLAAATIVELTAKLAQTATP